MGSQGRGYVSGLGYFAGKAGSSSRNYGSRKDNIRSFSAEHDRKRGGNDWRRSLPSIYVGNIEINTSKSDLEKLFRKFGSVADIFLHEGNRSREFRRSKFGFVRFFSMDGVKEALRRKNDCRCNGNTLIINFAEQRKERGRQKDGREERRRRAIPNRLRGAKSYAQAVRDPFVEGCHNSGMEQSIEDEATRPALTEGIVGELKGACALSGVKSLFREANVDCNIRPLGGLSVLFTFKEKMDLEKTIQDYREILGRCCSIFFICPSDFACSLRLGWVEMQRVPLRCWESKFFVVVGNFLGRFVLTEKKIEYQSKLDVARILVSCDALSKIPSSLVVTHRGREFKIVIRFVETNLGEVDSAINKLATDEGVKLSREKQTDSDHRNGKNGRGSKDGSRVEVDSNEGSLKRLIDNQQSSQQNGGSDGGIKSVNPRHRG